MIDRDCRKTYSHNGYRYVNYVNLDSESLIMVLNWRNHPFIRGQMYGTDIISPQEHFDYVGTLSSMDDRLYWLVFSDDAPVSCVNIARISSDGASAELGYFISPELIGSGTGTTLLFEMTSFLMECVGVEVLYSEARMTNIKALAAEKCTGHVFISVSSHGDELYARFRMTKDDFMRASMPSADYCHSIRKALACAVSQDEKVQILKNH